MGQVPHYWLIHSVAIPKHFVPSLGKGTSPERPGTRSPWLLGDGDSLLPLNAAAAWSVLSPCPMWAAAALQLQQRRGPVALGSNGNNHI